MTGSESLRCWVEIDLAALERNLHNIRAALPPGIAYAAVVKADAYGHGLVPTVSRLMHARADLFAVANVAEAAAIRELGAGWPVLILGPVLPDEVEAAVSIGVIPAISSMAEAEQFAQFARRRGTVQPVHAKIDTGMGRGGVWHEEAESLWSAIAAIPELRATGIFTHFSAAGSDPEFTAAQRQRFLDTLARLGVGADSELMIHADNSAGVENFQPGLPFNAVRVGLLQFGVRPYPKSLLGAVEVEPVLSFHSRVGLVKRLPAGESVSYDRTCRLERDTTVAIITAGYGDGVPVALSNRGTVLIRGQRCPILGRVTMDQIIVNASQIAGVAPGDPVVLIGRDGDEALTAAEVAQQADTIPWEIFCTITPRVKRVYRTALGV